MKTIQIFYFVLVNFLVIGCTTADNSAPKENSATEEDSTVVEESTGIIPIVSADYNRFILVKNTTEEYIKSMTSEHVALSGTDGDHYLAQFQILKEGDWFVVKVPQEIDFYTYHNLVGWYFGYDDNPDVPEYSIGFAEANKDINDSYMFYLDPDNEYGDAHIGVFKNGTTFTISLPDAYEKIGNITADKSLDINFEEIEYFLLENGYEPSNDETKYKIFEVKVYE